MNIGNNIILVGFPTQTTTSLIQKVDKPIVVGSKFGSNGGACIYFGIKWRTANEELIYLTYFLLKLQ